MSSTIRYLAVAAAVVIAAVIGINLAPAGSGIGGPGPSRTLGPTPTPISLPVMGDGPVALSAAGGTYLIGHPFPIDITVTVPGGWAGNVGGPYAAYLYGRAAFGSHDLDIAFSLSQDIYADPCPGSSFLNPQPGPTVDDLVTALAKLPGVNATTATDVTVDGLPGKQLTLTASNGSAGCAASANGAALWRLPLGAVFSLTQSQSMVVRILDVGGQRLVISSDTFAGSTAADVAALQQVLDSIHIVSPR